MQEVLGSHEDNQQEVDLDPEVQELVASRFDKLYNILVSDPKGKPLILTYGETRFRVGAMRLAAVKFFAHMASLRNPGFIDEMIRTGILRYLIVRIKFGHLSQWTTFIVFFL